MKFYVKFESETDLLGKLFMLSMFKVVLEAISNGEEPYSTVIMVSRHPDARLARFKEAWDFFKDNYEQEEGPCPICKDDGVECHHRVFLVPTHSLQYRTTMPRMEAMDSIPPGANPFHHDMDRMGSVINKRFTVMYHPTREEEVVLVDIKTGYRTKITVEGGE